MKNDDLATWFHNLILDIHDHIKEGKDIVFDEQDEMMAKVLHQKLSGRTE